MKKKISILGCGWLGLPLAAQLVQQGWQVNGSTTTPEKLGRLEAQGIRPFLLEVGDEVVGQEVDAFFNSEILLINIPPGRRQGDVLARYPQQIRAIAAQAIKSGIQKIIFISSTSVYPDTNAAVTELTPPSPTTDPGKAILQAEQFLQEQSIQLTILRMAGLVGGERRPGRWFAGKKDIPNGLAPVNLVHRDDCIAVIAQLLDKQIWGQCMNVCADKHPAKADFYKRQAELDGLQVPDFQLSITDGYKIVSSQKLKKELDYIFKYPDPMDFKF